MSEGVVSVLDRLRADTRVHKAVADADRIALARTPPTLDGYIEYLAKMYGFEAPLESALLAASLPRSLDMTKRMKARELGEDLCALGFPAENLLELPHCPLVALRSEVKAFAWLYVSECNRTSHQLFRTYLSHQLPEIRKTAGLQEGTTKQQWRELEAELEVFATQRPELIDELTRTAMDAFDIQHRWFHPSSPSGSVMQAAQDHAREVLRRRRSSGLQSPLHKPEDEEEP